MTILRDEHPGDYETFRNQFGLSPRQALSALSKLYADDFRQLVRWERDVEGWTDLEPRPSRQYSQQVYNKARRHMQCAYGREYDQFYKEALLSEEGKYRWQHAKNKAIDQLIKRYPYVYESSIEGFKQVEREGCL